VLPLDSRVQFVEWVGPGGHCYGTTRKRIPAAPPHPLRGCQAEVRHPPGLMGPPPGMMLECQAHPTDANGQRYASTGPPPMGPPPGMRAPPQV